MGCSSSAQTELQDANRPSSKQEERNGPSQTEPVTPEANGPITNEGETIPVQSRRLESREADTDPDEAVTSEFSPSEDGLELSTTVTQAVLAAVTPEDPEIPEDPSPVEQTTLSDADDIEELQGSRVQVEGESGWRVERETPVEAKDEVEGSEVESSATTETTSKHKED
ncbi:uncharacterized protein [Narcine bancroftii]|uniref:uncharacterized protein isoform X2 n=1 Tax=Narcine bancroftii TaxID=1343680 RepID=UPI0038317130